MADNKDKIRLKHKKTGREAWVSPSGLQYLLNSYDLYPEEGQVARIRTNPKPSQKKTDAEVADAKLKELQTAYEAFLGNKPDGRKSAETLAQEIEDFKIGKNEEK